MTTDSTPLARLRDTHTYHAALDTCTECEVGWPCDVVAALDALEALLVVSPADLEALEISTQSIIRHAESKDTKIRALQARIDAATVLIRDTDAFLEICDLQTHGTLLSHFCIFSEPRMRIRAWLAGDKEERQ